MSIEQPSYRTFILRTWQERRQGSLVWRFSLEDAQTKQRIGFTDLEGLCRFLAETGSTTASSTGN